MVAGNDFQLYKHFYSNVEPARLRSSIRADHRNQRAISSCSSFFKKLAKIQATSDCNMVVELFDINKSVSTTLLDLRVHGVA